MLSLISQGITLGFGAGAMPGPFQSYIISMTLAYGWRNSLITILTPLITDGPIILLVVFILKQVSPEFLNVIRIVGGLYLLWMAYSGWRRLLAGVSLNVNAVTQRRTLSQGLVMNWLSPGPYIFWATLNGPLLIQALNQSVWVGVAFLLAFYGTFLGFLALYIFVFDRLRRLPERITRGIFIITIVILTLFGLSLIGQGLGLISG
jgi:threonine/homoserine/homoserine lactone efflux protein